MTTPRDKPASPRSMSPRDKGKSKTHQREESVMVLSESDADDVVRKPPMNKNAMGSSGVHSRLFKAVYDGKIDEVRAALGTDKSMVKAEDLDHHTTMLHHAACAGHADMVSLLLGIGADVDAFDEFGFSALHFASMYGHPSVVKVLLEGDGKALLDHRCGNFEKSPGGTPLDLACRYRQVEVMQTLIEAGANLKSTDFKKRTILHNVVLQGEEEMVRFILKRKEAPKIINVKDKKGKTALIYAVEVRKLKLVEELLGANADPNIVDETETAPLHIACKTNQFFVAKALITKNANPNVKDENGQQPLDYASELGYNDIQYYLVNSNADISILYNGKNKEGQKEPPDERMDEYGFYMDKPLYKKLIIVPNREEDREAKGKLVKTVTKASENWAKMKENKKVLKSIRASIVKGTLTDDLRSQLWTSILTEHMEEDKKTIKYANLLLKDLELKHIVQIDKDIERAFRIHKTFVVRYSPGQCKLFRILRAYAAHDTETRYTQGMSSIAAILLLHFDDEEKAFYALVNLFDRFKLRDWYKNDLEGLRGEVFVVFPLLLEKTAKKTGRHLESINVHPSLYLTPWCLELFFGNIPYELVIRFWDLFMVYGPMAFYSMSLALIALNSSAIRSTLDMEGIHEILKVNPAEGLEYTKILKAATNKKFLIGDKKFAKLLKVAQDSL